MIADFTEREIEREIEHMDMRGWDQAELERHRLQWLRHRSDGARRIVAAIERVLAERAL